MCHVMSLIKHPSEAAVFITGRNSKNSIKDILLMNI